MQAVAQSLNLRGTHSLSSAWAFLALDAYTRLVESKLGDKAFGHLAVEQVDASGARTSSAVPKGAFPVIHLDSAVKTVRLRVGRGPPVFYSLVLAGFDQPGPVPELKEKLELIHSYEDDHGKDLARIKLGDVLAVRLKVRSTSRASHQHLAVVDLLPAGFEPVLQRGDASPGSARLIGTGSTWNVDHLDVREDRVIFYGSAGPEVHELTYRVKAVARGTFAVPPAFGEGMYDPSVRARSKGTSLSVE